MADLLDINGLNFQPGEQQFITAEDDDPLQLAERAVQQLEDDALAEMGADDEELEAGPDTDPGPSRWAQHAARPHVQSA